MNIEDLFNQKEVSVEDLEVTTLEEATKVAKEVSELSLQLTQLATAYEGELQALELQTKTVSEKYKADMKPIEEKLAKYNEKLINYHRSTLENATEKEAEKLKSIKLPHGVTLTSRSKAPALDVVDKSKYETFAQTQGYVKPPTIDWAGMKKKLTITEDNKVVHADTGEVLDFIEVKQQERTYDVKWS